MPQPQLESPPAPEVVQVLAFSLPPFESFPLPDRYVSRVGLLGLIGILRELPVLVPRHESRVVVLGLARRLLDRGEARISSPQLLTRVYWSSLGFCPRRWLGDPADDPARRGVGVELLTRWATNS